MKCVSSAIPNSAFLIRSYPIEQIRAAHERLESQRQLRKDCADSLISAPDRKRIIRKISNSVPKEIDSIEFEMISRGPAIKRAYLATELDFPIASRTRKTDR
jgi:hypothetical protein